MNIFSYAIRNIWRTRHRCGVVIFAMAFAGFIMINYAALLEGFVQVTERNAIGMESGLYQIHATGYRDDPDLYKRIDNYGAIISRLQKHGFKATGRLFGFALAASGTSSAGVSVRGVDLLRQPEVTNIHKHIILGRWLDSADPFGVVIGRKLAKTLGVHLDDEIVVVGQAADGSMANDLYRVRGIFKSVSEGIDRGGFFMIAKAYRDFYAVADGVHEIVIIGTDGKDDLFANTKDIAAMLPDYEVKNWRQLQPVVARIIDMSRSSLWIMLLVTYAAVGILTLNAVLMGVFDRIREFGVMKALGVTPRTVFAMIMTEAALQVIIAICAALLFGLPLALYGESHPLDLTMLAKSSSTFAGIAIDPVWPCKVTFASWFTPALFMLTITLLSAFYPAVKAALIRPVQAINHR